MILYERRMKRGLSFVGIKLCPRYLCLGIIPDIINYQPTPWKLYHLHILIPLIKIEITFVL